MSQITPFTIVMSRIVKRDSKEDPDEKFNRGPRYIIIFNLLFNWSSYGSSAQHMAEDDARVVEKIVLKYLYKKNLDFAIIIDCTNCDNDIDNKSIMTLELCAPFDEKDSVTSQIENLLLTESVKINGRKRTLRGEAFIKIISSGSTKH